LHIVIDFFVVTVSQFIESVCTIDVLYITYNCVVFPIAQLHVVCFCCSLLYYINRGSRLKPFVGYFSAYCPKPNLSGDIRFL